MMALKVSTGCFFFSLTSIVFFSQVSHSPHVVPLSDRRQMVNQECFYLTSQLWNLEIYFVIVRTRFKLTGCILLQQM